MDTSGSDKDKCQTDVCMVCEPSDFIKRGELLDQLKICSFLMDCAA